MHAGNGRNPKVWDNYVGRENPLYSQTVAHSENGFENFLIAFQYVKNYANAVSQITMSRDCRHSAPLLKNPSDMRQLLRERGIATICGTHGVYEIK